jgi:hypothetical protein
MGRSRRDEEVVVVMTTPQQPYGTTDNTPSETEPGSIDDKCRADAVRTLEKKRGWQAGMVAYVVVNAFLVGIWFMTGRGYFWPAWVLGGWGLGMALSFWDLYLRRPITEEDIEAELHRR